MLKVENSQVSVKINFKIELFTSKFYYLAKISIADFLFQIKFINIII